MKEAHPSDTFSIDPAIIAAVYSDFHYNSEYLNELVSRQLGTVQLEERLLTRAETIQRFMDSPSLPIGQPECCRDISRILDCVAAEEATKATAEAIARADSHARDFTGGYSVEYTSDESESFETVVHADSELWIESPKKRQREYPQYWTAEEAQFLTEAVERYNRRFTTVTKRLNAKFNTQFTIAQVEERWMRVQNPVIRKGRWSPEEDQLLLALLRGGATVDLICKKMPHRTRMEINCRCKSATFLALLDDESATS